MSSQLTSLGIRFQRIDALDARIASDSEIAGQFRDGGPLGEISKGDKCCSVSHRRAWKAFDESGDRFGLILEDDVAIDPEAAGLLGNDDWIPPEVDLLKLERFGPSGQRVLVGKLVKLSRGWNVGRLHSRHTGAGAYIISRRAVEILLGQHGRWAIPVDHMLFNPNISVLPRLLRPYQMVPPVARQSTAIGGRTDIADGRAKLRQFNWRYFRRELVRAYFELRILPTQLLGVIRGESSLMRIEATKRQPMSPLLQSKS